MAGGGPAASALSSPWRALLQRALDANAHLRLRWAPPAGRRTAPSCSGVFRNSVIRFRLTRTPEPTRWGLLCSAPIDIFFSAR
ncbi:Pyridoxine/pyridoxamine 5'-phosphate oxidase 2 [Zea mays]|uniref:Pyridoxine/pyridoxamine 5'-phosphate oxidase 2 n=1 Tax=Zea mays TaxID=4577 RepID=A0A1D6JL98_MAIZE|nr:Pyridoxine/pyridoxamine 5'-phosphate oxidase 2 [Zea mays]